MADTFQREIPKARINITLDVETDGAHRKKELPLKFLVLGDFSSKRSTTPLSQRQRISIHKFNFDQVLAMLAPTLTFDVLNTIKRDNSHLSVSLNFKKFKDFHPDQLVKQIPQLNQLVAMRNLLKDLKSHLLDNHSLRKEFEKLSKDKTNLVKLRNELKSKTPFIVEN